MNEVLILLLKFLSLFQAIRGIFLAYRKSQSRRLPEGWIDDTAVIKSLGIKKRALQALRDAGTLPHSRIGGKFYYKTDDVAALLESAYLPAKSTEHASK